MPRYRVLERSFLNLAIREVGEVVEYAGKPGKNLELIEDDPPARTKSAPTPKPVAPPPAEDLSDLGV